MSLEAIKFEIESLVDQLADEFDTAWNNRDSEKLASMFREDADFQFYNGLFLRSRAQIKKGYARNIFPSLAVGVRHKTELRQIRVLSEKVAIGNAKIYLTEAAEINEQKLTQDPFFATIVVVKDGGRWWISAVRLMIPNKGS